MTKYNVWAASSGQMNILHLPTIRDRGNFKGLVVQYFCFSVVFILFYFLNPLVVTCKRWPSVIDTSCCFTGLILIRVGELHILDRHHPEAWVRVPTGETLMFDLDLKLMCSCIFVILLSVNTFVFTLQFKCCLVELLRTLMASSVYSVKGMC